MDKELISLLEEYRKLRQEYESLYDKIASSNSKQQSLQMLQSTLASTGQSAANADMNEKVKSLLQQRLRQVFQIPTKLEPVELKKYEELLSEYQKHQQQQSKVEVKRIEPVAVEVVQLHVQRKVELPTEPPMKSDEQPQLKKESNGTHQLNVKDQKPVAVESKSPTPTFTTLKPPEIKPKPQVLPPSSQQTQQSTAIKASTAEPQKSSGTLDKDSHKQRPNPFLTADPPVSSVTVVNTTTSVIPALSNQDPPNSKPSSISALVNKFNASAQFSDKPTLTINGKDISVDSEDPFADQSTEGETSRGIVREYSRTLLDSKLSPVETKENPFESEESIEEEEEEVEDIFSDANQEDPVITDLPKSIPLAIYEALFDYNGQELSFKQGEYISVRLDDGKKSDEMHLYGSVQLQQQQTFKDGNRRTRSGKIPRNHVRLIYDFQQHQIPNLLQAMYNYTARQSDELELSYGSLVVYLERHDREWYRCVVVQGARNVGEIGLCPKSFLKEIVPIELSSVSASPRSSVFFEGGIEDPFGDQALIEDSPSSSLPPLPARVKPQVLETTTGVSKFKADASLALTNRQVTTTVTNTRQAAPQILQRETWQQHMDAEFVGALGEEERKRQETIFELIYTEWTFVRNLQIVLQVFYEPLKAASAVIKQREILEIFCNIDCLLMCNVKILSDLEQLQQRTQYYVDRIGATLLPHFSIVGQPEASQLLAEVEGGDGKLFAVKQSSVDETLVGYYRYCANQLRASKLLQQKLKDNQAFAEFIQTATKDPRCRSLQLSSYLLEPMQRVTRYPLLLKQILHYTDKDHPDHADLVLCLQHAEALLKNINSAARRVENIIRIRYLAESIDLSALEQQSRVLDLTAEIKGVGRRELLHQGELKKAKSGRKLVAFLFNDLLLFCEPASALSLSTKIKYTLYRKPLPLAETVVSALAESNRLWDKSETCFECVYEQESITVRAVDKTTRDLWLRKVNEANQQRKEAQEKLKLKPLLSATPLLNSIGNPVIVNANCIGTLKLILLDLSGPFNSSQSVSFIDESTVRKIQVYAEVLLGDQRQRSRVISVYPRDRERSTARWNQSMMFSVYSLDSLLRLRLMRYDKYSQNEELGTAEITLDLLEYYGSRMTEVMYLKLANSSLGGKFSLQMSYRQL